MQRNINFIEKVPVRFRIKLISDLDVVERYGIPGLHAVYVFGSCARGELRSSSDLDLLIVTDNKINDRVLAANLRCDLEEAVGGISTDVVFMNTDSLQEKNYFKDNIKKDMICVMEASNEE